MEVKKSRDADLEQRRVQGFLLGLIVVLAVCFVALEWNSSDSGWTFFDNDEDLEAEMELSPLKREPDEIPMMLPQEQQVEKKVDMYNEPVDFRVVEDLPQFPGGAAEFMKWLTKNLKYPASSQRQNVKGKVVAQFIVNVDGSVSDLELVEHLDAACDREVLRVLRMMPKWQAGVMNAKPCRTKVCIPIVFNM